MKNITDSLVESLPRAPFCVIFATVSIDGKCPAIYHQ